MTLKRQIFGMTIVPVILITCVSLGVSVYSILSTREDRISAYRETLKDQKKKQIMNNVEIAAKTIAGMDTVEEMRGYIRRTTFGENGYFFIIDFDHRFVAHPDPKLDGTSQADLKDPNGVFILRELVNVCKEKGEGVVVYQWNKLGADKPVEKFSFVKKVPGYDWLIGTGVYTDDIDRLVAEENERTGASVSSLVIMNLAVSAFVVVIVSFIVAYFVNGRINRPMTEIINTLNGFEGDLTVRIGEKYKYEFGDLAHHFDELMEKLHQVIGRVSGATMAVSSSVTQISATVEEQAVIAAEQSASVTEITSTMEEFSATSRQIAEHSNAVVELASRALENTKTGAEAVGAVKEKMYAISEDNQNNIKEIVDLGKKSREITKVMEIINNIADQTKLIAFNAAIEASSAGEAGRRFGVVAAEIRRLADNVMDSTGDIVDRIAEIQEAVNRLVIVSEKGSKRIQEGLEHSDRTALLLEDIVNGAKSTAVAAKQISLSTQQQETAGEQVVLALREIDEGARQTSASLGQVSATTSDLRLLAESLKELVVQFKLKEAAESRTDD